ncbi:HAMP domain-containing sensor histidine kinase [Paraburkholderia strydomiana]|uniref:histidine kinase n=1 Tax=Paraburkholderia strydomiana TaxID=1245417 RepID=A0ABW9EPS2_9BURK
MSVLLRSGQYAVPAAIIGNVAQGEEQTLFDSEPWGTIALDARYQVLFATSGAARLLGRHIETGTALGALIPELEPAHEPSDEGQKDQSPTLALAEGVEVALTDRWLWLRLEPAKNAGRVAALLRVSDMTDMRRALTNRAESLRFLSHDLRSPQNSIVALTQLHEQDPQAFEDCGGMQRIAELARYALSLGDQFIFTSVAGALRHRDFCRFDLRAAVRSVIPKLEVAAVYRNVALRLWIADEPAVWMSGVQVFVMRALQNLIDNAIQASRAGGRVTVSLKITAEHAVIVVSDEAGGLPGLSAGGAMTDFDGLGPKSIGGFGIGLKLSARIVGLHGGTLHAEANRDAGTDFVVRLPRLSLHRTGPRSPVGTRTGGLGHAAFERPPRGRSD